MTKPKGVESRVEGTVREVLPQGLYGVELEDHRIVKASISTEARRVIVTVKIGDRVSLKLHAHDPTRAAIESRLVTSVSRKRS